MEASRRRLILPLSLGLLVVVGAPILAWRAGAERGGTVEDRARVEAALRRLGYVRWDEIEMEDGAWEVDDARDAEGREWDLKLRADTLEVISRERDDD
ncbi:PepSY domain-containing protein [Paracraurococcus lichenis]|uniref:PepSY domain-containing protein n=1 Tax=Paracraurococcus lichenis TaxID=3064888 RepID=A0ABT9DTV0_9PROT|nr:PepSY domain-containing protein [Paracraurococcus sp. LOR1-02]MDO9707308.1 PepSY domain-containing protein [Paracraurococcus sp. LOR1-02]